MGSRATRHASGGEGRAAAGSGAVLPQQEDASPRVQSWLSLPLSAAQFPPWRLFHQEQMIRLLVLYICSSCGTRLFAAIFARTRAPPEFQCNYLDCTSTISNPGYRHILSKRICFIYSSRKQKFTSCELYWPRFSCSFLALLCHYCENLFNLSAPSEQ